MSFRPRFRRVVRPLLAGLALAAGGAAVRAAPPEASAWLAGGYDFAGILRGHRVQGGFLQYRWQPVWRGLSPWAGIGVGDGGPYFLGVGALYSIDLTPDWRVTGMFGPGFFNSQGKFVLGSELEFLSMAEISRRLPWGDRIGLGFGHISNGGLSRVNPGSEFIELGYQLRLPRRSDHRDLF